MNEALVLQDVHHKGHLPLKVKKTGKTKGGVTKSPVRGSKTTAYQQILNQELNGITDVCAQIGATDGKGGAQKAHSSKGAGPDRKQENNIIKHGPIFLAILVVFFTGQDSSYHVMARDMANINKMIKMIKKFTNKIKDIQDELNKLMKGGGDQTPQQIAQQIAQDQKDLQNLLKKYGGKLGKSLSGDINQFCKPGGDLDQIVKDATQGMSPPCNSWADAANNPQALDKIKKYLTNGGSPSKGGSKVFSDLSNLLGSLNTQNQGEVQKLNLVTKKVDSATKFVASANTMYKGIIQTLTNYSGS